MSYTITIGGTDRTTDVINQSITIQDVINDQVNTCDFELMDESGNGAPATDDEVIITVDGTKIFGGHIKSFNISKSTTGSPLFRIRCVDYTSLLDSNLVHKTYQDMTDKEIIEDIIDTYAGNLNITTTNVVEYATIDQITFNYIQPSQAFRQIAELTGRNWYIDYDKDIHYFGLTQTQAPFDISTTQGQIVEDITTFTNATLKNDASQYVTEVTLTDSDESQDGQVEYSTAPFPTNFEAKAIMQSKISNGGGHTYFYFGCSSTPRSITQTSGGYLLVLNELNNNVNLYFDGTLVNSMSLVDVDLDDGSFRTFRVTKTINTFKLFVDGKKYYEYTDTARTYGGTLYGVGADNNLAGATYSITNITHYSFSETTYDYRKLSVSKDASQVKNRIYVRGGTKLSDEFTYSEKGDGEKRVFVLPDKPHEVTVKVNTVEETVGIKNVDLEGFDWYLNYQEKYIEQDDGGTTLTSSDTLEVLYKYQIPILIAQEDSSSISENGVREFAIFDKTITTTQAARDRATAELTDYANDIVEGVFETETIGFRSGQYINVNLSEYNINDDYIVQRVELQSIGGGNFVYTISIASAKTLGIIKFLVEMLEDNRKLVELDNDESVDELFTNTDSLLSDSLLDSLIIDSQGAYFTWSTDENETTQTRLRWGVGQWM